MVRHVTITISHSDLQTSYENSRFHCQRLIWTKAVCISVAFSVKASKCSVSRIKFVHAFFKDIPLI